MMKFRDNPSYRHWNISDYKLVLENWSFQYCLLTDVNIAHSADEDAVSWLTNYGKWHAYEKKKKKKKTLTSTLTHFSLYQNSMVISSSGLNCESVWTRTMDILNTICNRDSFADCSLDLTLIVSFWKIAFLVCRWKQIIKSRSWNWTHLQFSTQCSNGCQCVLCYVQWFLFSIMSVTVPLFSGHSVDYYYCESYGNADSNSRITLC